jgi:hypothetical protein
MMSPSLFLILFGLVTAGVTFPVALYFQRREGLSRRNRVLRAGLLAFAMSCPALIFLLSMNFGRIVSFTFAAVVMTLLFLSRPLTR